MYRGRMVVEWDVEWWIGMYWIGSVHGIGASGPEGPKIF